ncbi:MAG: hypothetical protein H6723_17780 [Sandaracinus sp.]|nr:hypothetical protein [Sandaracinus sp.]
MVKSVLGNAARLVVEQVEDLGARMASRDAIEGAGALRVSFRASRMSASYVNLHVTELHVVPATHASSYSERP